MSADGVVAADGESSREPDGNPNPVKVSRAGAYQWAELMGRTFGVDVLACPRCGRAAASRALIEQASVIQRILRHLGLHTEVPKVRRPARAPRRPLETEDQSQGAPEFDVAC